MLCEIAMQALSEFNAECELKREAMNLLVKMLDETTIANQSKTFHGIDTDRTGTISLGEL